MAQNMFKNMCLYCYLYCLYFRPSSSVFIVDFEQIIFAGIVRYFVVFTRKQKLVLPTLEPIQDHSLFHRETNHFDLQLTDLLSILVERCFEMG